MYGEENLRGHLCFPCTFQVSPTHHHPVGPGEQRQHPHTVLSSPPRGTVSLRYDCSDLRTQNAGSEGGAREHARRSEGGAREHPCGSEGAPGSTRAALEGAVLSAGPVVRARWFNSLLGRGPHGHVHERTNRSLRVTEANCKSHVCRPRRAWPVLKCDRAEPDDASPFSILRGVRSPPGNARCAPD